MKHKLCDTPVKPLSFCGCGRWADIGNTTNLHKLERIQQRSIQKKYLEVSKQTTNTSVVWQAFTAAMDSLEHMSTDISVWATRQAFVAVCRLPATKSSHSCNNTQPHEPPYAVANQGHTLLLTRSSPAALISKISAHTAASLVDLLRGLSSQCDQSGLCLRAVHPTDKQEISQECQGAGHISHRVSLATQRTRWSHKKLEKQDRIHRMSAQKDQPRAAS